MAVRVQVPKKALLVRFVLSRWGKAFLGVVVVCFAAVFLVFGYYYNKFSRLIDANLAAGPFVNTSMLFASPVPVVVGGQTSPEEIAVLLRHSNYGESRNSRMGWYHLRPDAIEIFPGQDSYFDEEGGVVKFSGGKVSQIISLRDNTERTQYLLEPVLISNLFDKNREKRRLVKYEDIPQVLVNAVVSIEDKRFFQHSGFDPLRIIKAAYVDVKKGRNAEGASTLSMQLARTLWLTQERSWRRKVPEIFMTLHLEQKLSKKQIFEYYANSIDLGRRGTFAIRGFGEASQAYFSKDIRQLKPEEAATLAGLINAPSSLNPFRWPDRARQRRNLVLSLMRENGYLSPAEYTAAAAAPLAVVHHGADSTDAPYFVDMVNDTLLDQFQEHDFQTSAYRVYTTLDLDLQRDAVEAVNIGMKEVDDQLRRRARIHKTPYQEAQCALIALDPETGEVKAVVGGRNYGLSQLNHVLAKRQPGSVFKPFVYAAALSEAIKEGGQVITTASTFVDEPTTFWFDNKPYEPANFKHELHGVVTLRQALAHSMNIPTVKIAESIGYDKVVDLARRDGLNMDIRATPAVALGAYEVTPMEIAGAYTMYAERGVYVKPAFLKQIRDKAGNTIFESKVEQKPVLDPRVNYLMVNLLEEVLRSGTGAGVRGRGFGLPAAGKTGTSHDGWFAGFTSKLLCVVWVGFDDNHPLELEGAKSALPLWTEFMKRAHQHRQYRNVTPFSAPEGITSAEICSQSGQLATSACPEPRNEVFITGTQPAESCHMHGSGATQVAGWESQQPVVVNAGGNPSSVRTMTPGRPAQQEPVPGAPPDKKKKGVLGRLRDIFR